MRVLSILRSIVVLSSFLAGAVHGQNFHYPAAHKGDQSDDYHGTRVNDPYRWLEDDNSDQTARWVKAENALTGSYFDKIPYRGTLKERLEQLQNYPRFRPPVHRGDLYFFRKNDGLQNQDVVYVQPGLDGTPRVLLDPNTFSSDGTTRLNILEVSKNGKFAAYTVSAGGSDWQECHVMEVATGRVLPDRLQWLKSTALAWAGDGFFYSRYPQPESGRELSSKNENQMVYFHRTGDSQSQDRLFYADKAHPQRFHYVETTGNERYALLSTSDRGSGKDGNALLFRDLSKPDSPLRPIVSAISNDRYELVDEAGGKFLIQTNAHAPNGRVASYNPDAKAWKDIIAEKPHALTEVRFAGSKLLVEYSEDVASKLYIYGLDGKAAAEIQLPGQGTATSLMAENDDRFAFYAFSSLNQPETIYSYDLKTGKNSVWRQSAIPGFQPGRYESKEVFYQSKDGTRIPMFLVYRRGIKLDGSNPTLLYGYGGFNISNNPTFSAQRLALLEQGVVYASANLRGGGEYGEKWHQAGMLLNKQNVFDDFIAAAQWLIDSKYTSPAKLAIHGVSNGGLLIGAVMNQRPDLFRAAIAQAGVMDMLRFQKFTIGWNWIADYGSSGDPQQFKNLFAYSPLHNIREGVEYPATLITTADHDDRVVPGHSFKYAAALQEKASPKNPVLIRIDTNSGHGPSSTRKGIEQNTDIDAFLLQNLGVKPSFETPAPRKPSTP